MVSPWPRQDAAEDTLALRTCAESDATPNLFWRQPPPLLEHVAALSGQCQQCSVAGVDHTVNLESLSRGCLAQVLRRRILDEWPNFARNKGHPLKPMLPMRHPIPRNILYSIEARRYGSYSRRVKSTYRYNNRIMKNLTASPDRVFKRVMRIKSPGSIAFDGPDKLYVGNDRDCYALRGARGAPFLLYSIDPHTYAGRWRYESSITITRAGLTNRSPPSCDLRLRLISKSLLEVREENTGEIIGSIIDLNSPDSPSVQFTTLCWDKSLHRVIAISTKPKEPSNIQCYFVLLEICPVVRKALRVPIRKDVFGQDITDVALSDGILRVTHRPGAVKLYDFLSVFRANRVVDGARDQVLEIKALVGAVFAVNDKVDIEFGGFPWHYIGTSRLRHEYSVCGMDHAQLAVFPVMEDDKMTFYPDDDSGIITHFHGGSFTLYRIKDGEVITGTKTLEQLRVIKLVDSDHQRERERAQPHAISMPERRSRRTMTRPSPSFIDEDDRVLFCEDFEDELNLILLMGIDGGDLQKRSVIQFFDYGTGKHVKTMRFSKKVPRGTEYLVSLDLDVLVVIAVRNGGSHSEAHVYRLLHREAWGDECPEKLYALPGASVRQTLDPDFVP